MSRDAEHKLHDATSTGAAKTIDYTAKDKALAAMSMKLFNVQREMESMRNAQASLQADMQVNSLCTLPLPAQHSRFTNVPKTSFLAHTHTVAVRPKQAEYGGQWHLFFARN